MPVFDLVMFAVAPVLDGRTSADGATPADGGVS